MSPNLRKLLGFVGLIVLITAVLALAAQPASAQQGRWTNETVNDQGGEDTSLELDSNGNPHISYRSDTGAIKYTYKDGGSWTTETVDSVGGSFTSLELDSDGDPHITYFTGNLTYAYKDGGSWTTEVVDSQGTVGSDTSLELDSDGDPHVTYHRSYPFESADVKYASKQGGSWTTETVESQVSWIGSDTSLELDTNGDPHISYKQTSNSGLKYATKQGGSWTTELVDTEYIGSHSSLELDTSGNPHIGYHDSSPKGEGGNKLAYASKQGGSWTIEIADSRGFVGSHTSLELDANGNPHISYYNSTSEAENLKYATKQEGSWTTETADSENGVGYYSSLEVDRTTSPHISYYDVSDGELKFAVAEVIGTPSAPVDLQATSEDGSVELNWTPPTDDGGADITAYRLYRGTSSGSETPLVTVTSNRTSYNDTGVDNGIEYYYYVTARNTAGESSPSNEVSATPGATDPRAGPGDVTGDGNPAQDPDDNGLYEDVNGDGDVTPGDATVLFNAVFEGNTAVTENVSLFDFNGDGSVTPGDATVLFNEIF